MNPGRPSTAVDVFDPTLLARMTGKLGDRDTIAERLKAIAAMLSIELSARLTKTAGGECRVEPQEIFAEIDETGQRRLAGARVQCTADLGPWSPAVRLASEERLVVTLVDTLLGGDGASQEGTQTLSAIELDISRVLFEDIAAALAAVVAPDRDGDAILSAVEINAVTPGEDDATPDHPVMASFAVTLGQCEARIMFIVEQSAIMKTRIIEPVRDEKKAGEDGKTRGLSRRLSGAPIALRADIALEPVTLGALSRLAPGDILSFKDGDDVKVLLSANGKELYWCDLGRASNRYTIRLKQAHGSENTLMHDLGMA